MALPAQNPASIGTGKDYSTVAAWEADLDSANLDANYAGEVYGLTEDNSSVYFDGVNSTAAYKAILRAATGEEADGTDNKGAQIDVTIMPMETTDQWNMDIETIEFHTAGYIYYAADHADNVCNITKCVFRSAAKDGIKIATCGAAEINIGVCLLRDITTAGKGGILHNDADPTTKIINCTAYHVHSGCVYEVAGGCASVKNCVSAYDEIDAAYYDYRGTPQNMSYCADSGDNTATGTGSIHTAARADEWVDYAADNFKVKDTNAHIYHAGIQITGESWFPATDMAGVAWNNPPSMGCFEYVAAGGLIQFASALSALSGTGNISLAVKRPLGSSMAAQTQAGSIGLAVLRALNTSIAALSNTCDMPLAVKRPLGSVIDAQTATSNIELSISGLVQFASLISATSDVADISLAVKRALGSSVAAQTTTGAVPLIVSREFASAISGQTNTASITLDILVRFISDIAGAVTTADISLAVDRALNSAIDARTATSDIALLNILQIASQINASTNTSDIDLLVGLLGIIIDPSITSMTPVRVLESMTPVREIESKTILRTILPK